LVKNNARVGAQIARELNKIQKRFLHTKTRSKAIVIGGSVMDIISRHVDHQSSVGGPGHCHQIMGGVGRNMAEACLKSGISPAFVSVTGKDAFGDVLQQSFQNLRLVMLYRDSQSRITILLSEETVELQFIMPFWILQVN
jgi:pseudouridine-5'-phosphate glycosidase/pseudouridine kinase